MASHFIFVHCFTHYPWASDIWTFIKPTSSSTSTPECTSKISLPCPLFLKVLFPFLSPLFPFLPPLSPLFLDLSFHCILSNCLPPLPPLSPPLLLRGVTSGFQGLLFDLFLGSAVDILLNLTCMVFMSCQILPMSAAMGFTMLFSMCCPMENTLGSLGTLADPGTAFLILGFESRSIKKDFSSFNVL